MNPPALISYEYLTPESSHILFIRLNPLPNSSIVPLKKSILAIVGFLRSDDRTDYIDVNNMEFDLLQINAMIADMKAIYMYSGELYGGEL